MSAVEIYMEGGGTGKGTADLRRGMDKFLGELKDAARSKEWRWNLVLCGNRHEAYDKFNRARDHAREGEIIALLVDAEVPVKAQTSVEHLQNREGDGWDLTGVLAEHVHLMVQTMETWIIADSDALKDFYGPGFRANALPSRQNLEEEDKTAVENALYLATRKTKTKGRYHKIEHASKLLELIDSGKVRRRCRHCELLFSTLGAILEAG